VRADEPVHLEKSVSLSYSISFSGVMTSAGPLPVLQQARHLHTASPTQMCPYSNAFAWFPCSQTKVVMRHGTSEYSAVHLSNYLGCGMTLSLGRQHAYEKDTPSQTMHLPLGE